MALTIQEVAEALGVAAQGDAQLRVVRPAEPGEAGADDLALAMTPAYGRKLKQTRAKSAVVWQGCDWAGMGLKAAIEVPRARLALARLTQAFDAAETAVGIHPTTVIDPTAHVGEGVSIGAFCVIGADVRIGDNTHLADHVSLARGVDLGPDGVVHAGVRIGRNVRIGARVVLQPNVVIGADGFSFVTEDLSNEERAVKTVGRAPLDPPKDATRHRIHSLGSVVIGDDVEVGANSTIDAGTIRPTQVGNGTKIDNLVQVGHNVIVGQDCVLCAQAAVAGSAILGDRVVMGGKSGIRDQVRVGRDVVLGGGAIVLNHVADGSFMMGYPAAPMTEHRAREKAIARLAKRRDD